MKLSAPQNFVIHDQDGRIVSKINCPVELMKYQAIPVGGGHLEANDESWSSHYVAGGHLVAKPPQPSPVHEFDYNTKCWVDPRSLEQLKADKWEALKKARDVQEFGGFWWNECLFDSDAVSQQRIVSAAQGAMGAFTSGMAYTKEWTLADNSTVNLNADQMIDVASAMDQHIGATHFKFRELRARIDEAKSEKELAEITW